MAVQFYDDKLSEELSKNPHSRTNKILEEQRQSAPEGEKVNIRNETGHFKW